MDRLEKELSEIAAERFDGDFGILDEYRRHLGVRGALAKLARGWLIERARTRRLRAQLDDARREAEAMRDRFIDSEQDRDDTAGRYTEFGLPWEEVDAAP